MRTYARTPQQRDRRFARVRTMTQAVLIGSGVASGAFVGYAASTAKPVVALGPTTTSSPTTTQPSSTPTQTPSSVYTPPTPAPVTTTTTCYTTPSGSTVCY